MAAESRAQVEAGGEQLLELMSLRERFGTTLRAIVDDFGREIDRVEQTGVPGPVAWAPPTLPLAEPEADVETLSPLPAVAEPVELDIGPLRDYAAVAALERALAAVPQVMEVYVRRYAAERAAVELTVAADLDLPAALELVLPQGFRTERVGDVHRIELTAPVPVEAAQ